MENIPLKMRHFAYNMVYIVIWVIEMLLLARFVLKLLGANAGNQLIAFVYSASEVFIRPFSGIFPTAVGDTVVVEPNTMLAMVVYAVIGYMLIVLLGMVARYDRTY